MEEIFVASEIGKLKKLLIHSPDAGIGKVAPSMKDELLYDDIVYLNKMQEEYTDYLMLLLHFLDPEKAKSCPDKNSGTDKHKDFFNPESISFHASDKVVDVEFLLGKILSNQKVKSLLVASICAIEKCDIKTQIALLKLKPAKLAKVLITGFIEDGDREVFLFAPLPNMIFTRDIGVVIKDHFLLTKPFEQARSRESLLTKYIAYFNLFNIGDEVNTDDISEKVIELTENEMFLLSQEKSEQHKIVSVEGGDVMMISPEHLIVGASERTTLSGIDRLVHELFSKKLVKKVSVVKIPRKRAYMHIDTVFTQVKRDMWVCFNPLSNQEIMQRTQRFDFSSKLSSEYGMDEDDIVKITQFKRIDKEDGRYEAQSNSLKYLDDLFEQISKEDFGADKCEIIYCSSGVFPYNEREQWTDACNYLTIQEGVIVGYDRNTKTTEEFRKRGFNIITSQDFIAKMNGGAKLDEVITGDTMILLPSAELSRARGGTHCMSLPLLREQLS